MKHNTKKFAALLACLATVTAVAGISGCSMFLQEIEGGGSGGGGGGGGDDGTYTFDVTAYDSEWADKVVDSSLWRVTANIGAYAKNTLVLNDDGTYELTKEMGADEVATERWSKDGGVEDRSFLWYKYYGNYTQDGSVVTLEPCTKIAVETDVFLNSQEYNLGNFPIDYTETTDLTTLAGTCHEEKVVDFFVGPYIAVGEGNVAQTVTLGTYDWGTFTFNGTSFGDDDEPDEPVDTRPSYTFTSGTNEEITFSLYADGTYTFAWAANDVSESGTYTWNRLTQTLVITDPADKDYTVVAEDGKLAFTYYYSQSDQLLQAYTGDIADMEAVICEVVYSMIPTAVGNISLDLYADNTYTFTDAANAVAVITETGTYDWDGEGTLTLVTPDEEEIVSHVQDDLPNIVYLDYSSRIFIGSLADMAENVPSAAVIFEFVGLKNNAYTFELFDDFTYRFYDGQHGVTEEGTWAFIGETLTLTFPGEILNGTGSVMADYKVEDGVMSFTYNYSVTTGLNQPFSCNISELKVAIAQTGLAKTVYTFTGLKNELYNFTIYDSGAYLFYDGQHDISEYGVWAFDGETLALNVPGSEAAVVGDYTLTDGTMSFTYYYSQMSALNQPFKCDVVELNTAIAQAGLSDTVHRFVGARNSAYTLTLYENGIYCFHDSEHSVFEYGVWGYENEILTLTFPGEILNGTGGVIADYKVENGVMSFTYNYSVTTGLNQPFTCDLMVFNTAIAQHGLSDALYTFIGQTNDLYTLTLDENGIYCFYDGQHGVAEYGLWEYAEGTLMLTFPGTISNGTGSVMADYKVEGGVMSFTYNYSITTGLNQPFSCSVEELSHAIYGVGTNPGIFEGGAA